MLTSDIMREMWPHGDAKIPGLVDGIAAAAAGVFLKYRLTSDLLVAHAMAQFSHECGAGTEVVENPQLVHDRHVFVGSVVVRPGGQPQPPTHDRPLLWAARGRRGPTEPTGYVAPKLARLAHPHHTCDHVWDERF
jgi:hypothetical protein